MSDNKQNSKQYTATDIERYLKGQMSAAEMHAIETAALDDPFLADAIEGFEMARSKGSEESVMAGLKKLNKQFSDRVKPVAKILPMTQSRWWQIAAAVVIFVIVGVAVYNNRMTSDEATNSQLAVTEKKESDRSVSPKREEKQSDAVSVFSDSQQSRTKNLTKPVAPSVEPETISAPLAATNQKESTNELSKKETPPALKEGLAKTEGYAVNREDTLRFKSSQGAVLSPVTTYPGTPKPQKDVASATNTEAISRKNNQLAEQLNKFSGRVVDPNNKPLAYASVQIAQSKTNLTTDQSGNFNFSTKDSVVDVHVRLSGFEQRNFRLQNNLAVNNLVLEPHKEALEEVVVTGYGTQRKKDVSKTTIKVQDAVPEIGWIEYEKYLENNKKPPANNPLMKGEVVVSFQVRQRGILSDFKIEKSLSKDYDKEAIRLVRDGPTWKLLSSRKTRITVIVKF